MPREKGKKTADIILSKAKDLFIQQGYAATSMDELVSYSGVSKGSIYYHFKNKEDLFVHVLKKNYTEWQDEWYAKKHLYNGIVEQLYGMAEHMAKDFHNPLMKVSEEFSMSQLHSEQLLEQLLEITYAPRAIYEELFEAAMKEGAIKQDSPRDLAIVFAALMDGLSVTFYHRDYEELQRLYRKAVDSFLYGVLPS